jgi:hypothetical protein
MRTAFLILSLLNGACVGMGIAVGMFLGPAHAQFNAVFSAAFAGFLITWAIAVVAGIAYGLIAPDMQPRDRGIYCRSCRYPLQGLSGPRCPECGRSFDPSDVLTFSRYQRDATRWPTLAAVAWLVLAGLSTVSLAIGSLRMLFPFW